MNHKTVHFLDLPDEILLIIMKKLGSMDVLYSLLGVNQRLDQMAKSINNTQFLDLSIKLPIGEFFPIDNIKLNRFCNEILPQIHHNIIALTLNFFPMKHILHACEYPNLNMIVIKNDLMFSFFHDLSEESPIARLLREQIIHITVDITHGICSNIFFTNICANILANCTRLSCLNINQRVQSSLARLSLWNRSLNFFNSSHLRNLSIDVKRFDDCRHLLDGRLDQLSSFTVKIHSIERFSMINNNEKKVISNLKEFSLTCYSVTDAYDRRILPLLRRMPNLNSLTLHFNINRSKIIDGIHLNEKILYHMLHLNAFVFNICTIMLTSETNNFLSTNNIQNTFINWKYSSVSCYIDHFSNGYTYSHIYSIPFKMTHFKYLTNSFRDHHLESVIDLTLYDTRPFEHDFFEWISRGFPLLKYLKVNNLTSKKNKRQIESVNNKQISYLHLIRLQLTDVHIDYVDQFLVDKNAYVPCLCILKMQYEQLVTVTKNFTNDATRHNCGQLKELIFNGSLVYPEHFSLYFPCLEEYFFIQCLFSQ